MELGWPSFQEGPYIMINILERACGLSSYNSSPSVLVAFKRRLCLKIIQIMVPLIERPDIQFLWFSNWQDLDPKHKECTRTWTLPSQCETCHYWLCCLCLAVQGGTRKQKSNKRWEDKSKMLKALVNSKPTLTAVTNFLLLHHSFHLLQVTSIASRASTLMGGPFTWPGLRPAPTSFQLPGNVHVG